jgi:hypothetical protein
MQFACRHAQAILCAWRSEWRPWGFCDGLQGRNLGAEQGACAERCGPGAPRRCAHETMHDRPSMPPRPWPRPRSAARAGFGQQHALAHVPGQQGLAMVLLILWARCGQVFALEVEVEASSAERLVHGSGRGAGPRIRPVRPNSPPHGAWSGRWCGRRRPVLVRGMSSSGTNSRWKSPKYPFFMVCRLVGRVEARPGFDVGGGAPGQLPLAGGR